MLIDLGLDEGEPPQFAAKNAVSSAKSTTQKKVFDEAAKSPHKKDFKKAGPSLSETTSTTLSKWLYHIDVICDGDFKLRSEEPIAPVRAHKGASLANPNKKARKYQAIEFESDEE